MRAHLNLGWELPRLRVAAEQAATRPGLGAQPPAIT